MKYLILILFIVLFMFLLRNKENFEDKCSQYEMQSIFDLPCFSDASIKMTMKYDTISKDVIDNFRKSVNSIMSRKVTYTCPAPVVAGIGGTTTSGTAKSVVQYGFNPDEVSKLDSTLVKNVHGTRFVSNVDMIPLLIALIKEFKMSKQSSTDTSNNLQTRVADVENRITEINTYINAQ